MKDPNAESGALSAAVVVNAGYTLLTGPFSLDNPTDFKTGIQGILNSKNSCPIQE